MSLKSMSAAATGCATELPRSRRITARGHRGGRCGGRCNEVAGEEVAGEAEEFMGVRYHGILPILITVIC